MSIIENQGRVQTDNQDWWVPSKRDNLLDMFRWHPGWTIRRDFPPASTVSNNDPRLNALRQLTTLAASAMRLSAHERQNPRLCCAKHKRGYAECGRIQSLKRLIVW